MTKRKEGMSRMTASHLADCKLPSAQMPAQDSAYVPHAFGAPPRPVLPTPKSGNALGECLTCCVPKPAKTVSSTGPRPSSTDNLTPKRLVRLFSTEPKDSVLAFFGLQKNIRDMLILPEQNVIKDQLFSKRDWLTKTDNEGNVPNRRSNVVH